MSTEGLGKIRKPQLYELIIQELENAMLEGKLKPGDRLPPERELCEQLGVSRASLREALRTMAFLGWLEVRPGDGLYVANADPDRFVKPLSYILLLNKGRIGDLLEVRGILESEAAALAAMRCTDLHLARLADLYSQMETSTHEIDRYFKLDMEFHDTVGDASENPILERAARIVRQILEEALMKVARLDIGRKTALEAHRRLHQALAKHDTVEARKAAAAHAETVREIIMGAGGIM